MSIEVLPRWAVVGPFAAIVAGRTGAVRHPKVPRVDRGGPGASAHRRIVPAMRRWTDCEDAGRRIGRAPGSLDVPGPGR